jgi:hypothetical protein
MPARFQKADMFISKRFVAKHKDPNADPIKVPIKVSHMQSYHKFITPVLS